VVRDDRRTDGDAAIFGNFEGDIADAANIDVAVLFGKNQFAGNGLRTRCAVEQRALTPAHSQEFALTV
jgi:hypothetical protein